MHWRIDPDSLQQLLLRVHHDYPGVPLVITENGAAFDDVVDRSGAVHDVERIAYIDAHLRSVNAAIDSGVDVRGYFVWTLLDNFEWAWGLAKRFGVIHVDYATEARTLKDSALWYRDVIAGNGLPPR
jgi:beta-glucosidase